MGHKVAVGATRKHDQMTLDRSHHSWTGMEIEAIHSTILHVFIYRPAVGLLSHITF